MFFQNNGPGLKSAILFVFFFSFGANDLFVIAKAENQSNLGNQSKWVCHCDPTFEEIPTRFLCHENKEKAKSCYRWKANDNECFEKSHEEIKQMRNSAKLNQQDFVGCDDVK